MVRSRPCMLCGKELWAKYSHYKLLKQENAWRGPRTVGRICEDCFKKTLKKGED